MKSFLFTKFAFAGPFFALLAVGSILRADVVHIDQLIDLTGAQFSFASGSSDDSSSYSWTDEDGTLHTIANPSFSSWSSATLYKPTYVDSVHSFHAGDDLIFTTHFLPGQSIGLSGLNLTLNASLGLYQNPETSLHAGFSNMSLELLDLSATGGAPIYDLNSNDNSSFLFVGGSVRVPSASTLRFDGVIIRAHLDDFSPVDPITFYGGYVGFQGYSDYTTDNPTDPTHAWIGAQVSGVEKQVPDITNALELLGVSLLGLAALHQRKR